MTEKSAALLAYSTWKQLRRETDEHRLSCECVQCSKRRKLGGVLDLPYAGAPAVIRFKKGCE